MTEDKSIKQKSLYERLRSFIEKNREDNEQYKTGWQKRLQNIYVAHYDSKNIDAGNTRHWQKYPDKKQ